LLSGSGIERAPFVELAEKNHLQPLDAGSLSHSCNIDAYEYVIVQGGLSSISECLARKKFLVVIPISSHPEQALNAYEVEKMGHGLAATLKDLDSLPALREKISRRKAQLSLSGTPDFDGAKAAASRIFKAARIAEPR
jgi:uncharacterized protein (TIGR00661 family)